VTTPLPRRPGKYGRRPPKRARSIPLAPFLTGVLPDHPPYVDYLAQAGGGWAMLGNGPDPENATAGVPPGGAGDCVAVAKSNGRRLVTGALIGVAAYPTLSQTIAFYKTQNPGFPSQDEGMDMQTALETCVHAGGPDGVKALGFASADPTSPEEVKAAIAIAGYVEVGFLVQAANESQFANGRPWDYVPGSPNLGGHAVIAGGYGMVPGETGQLGGDEKMITWGQETSFTSAEWAEQVEECWLVIWPEHLGSREFMAGLDVAGFARAYEQITGRPFPAPPPTPTPPPTPPPPPPPPPPQQVDDVFAAVLMGADRGGRPWYAERHTTGNKRVADAARAWLAARGYIAG
jgi:hypothetical protein